jgi:hypothetical protein
VSVRFLTQTAAVAVVLLAHASICAAQYSQGMEVNTTVETTLEQGRFRQPLPFDVPFYIQAPIDNDVEEVQGKYARRHDLTCEMALREIPTQPSLTSFLRTSPPVGSVPTTTAEPQPPERGSILGWLGYANIFVTEKGLRVFELGVPALKPRKDYCFQFVLRKKTDPATARAIVARALDLELRRIIDETGISDDAGYDNFRQRVLDEIDAHLAREQTENPAFRLVLDVPPNSFFSRTAKATDILQRYRNQFGAVVQAQANRRNAATNFGTNVAPAVNALTTLLENPRTSTLIAALEANNLDPLISARLTAIGTALALDGRSASEYAFGTDAAVPDSLLDYASTWNPAVVNARVRVLEKRVRELTEFAGLAGQLVTNQALQRAAGLAAAPGAPPAPGALSENDLKEISAQAGRAVIAMRVAHGLIVRLETLLTARTAAIAVMAEQVGAELERVVRFTGTTTADWRTRATAYMSADVGLAYSKGIQSFFFYLGANIYLGPVNKKATLSLREDGLRSSIRKRLAVMFGIPVNPFDETKDPTSLNDPRGIQLDGVIGARPVLLGAGIRLTELVRLTGGTVIFKVRDPNPLVVDAQLRRAGFISISVDWDLRGSFSALVGNRPPSTP